MACTYLKQRFVLGFHMSDSKDLQNWHSLEEYVDFIPIEKVLYANMKLKNCVDFATYLQLSTRRHPLAAQSQMSQV